jgi:hypothetical protein
MTTTTTARRGAVASLNVHQSTSDNHDRLGFHPDCPTCRQDRLFAVLSPQPAFSYRVRVLLATGVLALSAGGATTSIASEPDSHEEGISAPGQEGSAAPGNSADGHAEDGQQTTDDELGQDPSDETPLPIEVEPVPSGPQDDSVGDGTDEATPLEPQPTPDPDDGLGLTDPGALDGIDVGDGPAPPTEANPPVAPTPPVTPPLEADVQAESPDSTATPAPHRTEDDDKGDHRTNGPSARERHTAPAPAPPATTPAPASTPALSATAQPEPAPIAVPVSPSPGTARFLVVQPGESLWSIAADLLRPGASAAAIVSELQRLWDLNEARIGTGEPDLLPVGVKLRLR